VSCLKPVEFSKRTFKTCFSFSILPFHQFTDLPIDLFLSNFTSHILYTHHYILCILHTVLCLLPAACSVTSSYPYFVTVTSHKIYYVKSNIEVRSSNHCCPRKPVGTEYYACVCPYYCVSYQASKSHLFSAVLYICGLSSTTLFFQIIS
jgi:hypothetical protein